MGKREALSREKRVYAGLREEGKRVAPVLFYDIMGMF